MDDHNSFFLAKADNISAVGITPISVQLNPRVDRPEGANPKLHSDEEGGR